MPSTSRSADSAEGAATPSRHPGRFGLPRTARLTRAADFRRVYGRGRRAHGRWIVVIALRRRAPGHRLGIAVSKEHGRAVRRNKIKRILREAFRLERPELAGAFDVVVIPRAQPGRYLLEEIRRELAALLQQLDEERGRAPRDRRPRRRRKP